MLRRDGGYLERLFRFLACIALLAMSAAPAATEPLRRAETAPLAFSERLRLVATGPLLADGRAGPATLAVTRARMERLGFYHRPGQPCLIAAEVSLAPLLAWDDNINGGLAQETLTLNGWTFAADPDTVAKTGLVLGGTAGGLTRYALSEGRYLELSGRAALAWSPEHDIGRSDAQIRLCSANHLRGWTFLDACLLSAVADRQLGTARLDRASMTLSTLFDHPGATHELRGSVALSRTDRYEQPSLVMGHGMVWDRAATDLELTLGAGVEDETVQRHRLTARVRFLAADRPLGLTFWQAGASGGTVLGVERTDGSAGVSLAVDITPRVSLAVGYSETRSTVELFDARALSLEVGVDGFRW